VRVWLTAWEWQCCGEPFRVGAEVLWPVVPASDVTGSWLAEPLGKEVARAITHYETHHDEEPAPTIRARVVSIDAVYWELAPRPSEDPGVRYPVPKTGVLERRQSADGAELEIDGGPSFAGYIVELASLD
jgi:hypothetical protein